MTQDRPKYNPESIQPPKTEEKLRELLTPIQYRVTQENGTELAFFNEYWNHSEPGIYVDVVSGEPLFSSLDKFQSSCGWPAFSAPLEPENIHTVDDTSHGLIREELRSKGADSHLGHLFDDGPLPTGLRYCVNSAALRFIPVEKLEAEGYGQYLGLFETSSAAGDEKKKFSGRTATATFGAGCFWGVESAFRELDGVLDTAVGYMGGNKDNPTYEDVRTGQTGHAEVVSIEYDPEIVSYEELVNLFFRMHDPTSLNRQGPDSGTQYRSVIFTYDAYQKGAANDVKDAWQVSGRYQDDIVTQIVPASRFWRAEECHQRYFEKNGGVSCHLF